MSKGFSRVLPGVVLAVLVLVGCFRQAGPGIRPTLSDTSSDQVPVPSPTTEQGATPFVTPFLSDQGPDMTAMPTLGSPSPTLSLVVSGTPGGTPVQAPDAGEGPGAQSLSSPAPTNTAPFAAGPTYTPIPGVPTVDLSADSAPTPTRPPAGPADEDRCTYTVQAGDTAFYVATIHGITLVELIEANNLQNADYLYEGQVLQIPGCGENAPIQGQPSPFPPSDDSPPPEAPPGTTIHVVQSGENLFRISLRYGVTVQDIVDANNLGSADAILSVGQRLIIPNQ